MKTERCPLVLLSPLGERLGEGVMQEKAFGLTPSPNLSPKGERNLKTGRCPLMLLSPLGERLGEGVMQERTFGLTPSPDLSPRGRGI